MELLGDGYEYGTHLWDGIICKIASCVLMRRWEEWSYLWGDIGLLVIVDVKTMIDSSFIAQVIMTLWRLMVDLPAVNDI